MAECANLRQSVLLNPSIGISLPSCSGKRSLYFFFFPLLCAKLPSMQDYTFSEISHQHPCNPDPPHRAAVRPCDPVP